MGMPNLFIAGGPKCGTTSLHDYLGQHPDILVSSIKEPKFYLSDGQRLKWHGPGDELANHSAIWDRTEYLNLFKDQGMRPWACEASPYYLWSREAQLRIRHETPDARFIILLRDPVGRAISNWLELRNNGRERMSTLSSALSAEPERRQRGWEPFWFYRDLGLYGQQLEHLFSVFPAGQVKVCIFDSFVSNPLETLSDLYKWLDVRTTTATSIRRLGRTPNIPQTASNRIFNAIMSVPPPVRYFLPKGMRSPLRRSVSRAIRKTEIRDGPAQPPPDLGVLFADDLVLLRKLVPGIPRSWGSS